MIFIESRVYPALQIFCGAHYDPSTTVAAPGYQATGLTLQNGISTTLDVGYTAALGAPSGYLVIAVPAGDLSQVPADNVPYNTGDMIGNGIVVYRGALLACQAANLNFVINSYYKLYVFAYNQVAAAIAYNKINPLVGSFPFFIDESCDAVNDFPTVFNDVYFLDESCDAVNDLPLYLPDVYYIDESTDA